MNLPLKMVKLGRDSSSNVNSRIHLHIECNSKQVAHGIYRSTHRSTTGGQHSNFISFFAFRTVTIVMGFLESVHTHLMSCRNCIRCIMCNNKLNK